MKLRSIDEVRKWLNNKREMGFRLEDIARDSKLSYNWITRFARGDVRNPPYDSVCSIIRLMEMEKD